VPYPFAAQAHQSEIAARMEAVGAAVVLADRELQAGGLRAILDDATQPERLAQLTQNANRMKGTDAVAAIVARIETLLARKK
jgi:UDP-N-acetylglucosamine:LPS N-acetylglucosamine transferase